MGSTGGRVNEIIIPIIGGLFLVIGALFAYLGTRGKTRADAKAAMDARIDERVGEELDRLYTRIDTLEKRLEDAETQLETSEKRLGEAETQIENGEQQALEMIQHIVMLEGLVPNPPGPPTRPNWKLPILTERRNAT